MDIETTDWRWKKTDKQQQKKIQNGAIFCDWVYFVLLKRRDFYFWGSSTQNCIHFCAHWFTVHLLKRTHPRQPFYASRPCLLVQAVLHTSNLLVTVASPPTRCSTQFGPKPAIVGRLWWLTGWICIHALFAAPWLLCSSTWWNNTCMLQCNNVICSQFKFQSKTTLATLLVHLGTVLSAVNEIRI